MKYFLLIAILLATGPIGHAARHLDSIANYYNKKYEAELAIVDSEYAKALSLYSEAFTFKRPHEKDVYNAFILCCILNDTTLGKTYFNKLVSLGLPQWVLIDDLLQDKLDTNFIHNVNADYSRIRNAPSQSRLKENARIMEDFYSFDQGIRQYAINTYGQVEGIKKYNDSIKSVDSINVSRMLAYIQERGFPDIYETGFYADNYKHISSYPMIFLLLRHTTSMPSFRPDKSRLLKEAKKAVLAGKYDPRDYAFVYDESEGNRYGSVFEYTFHDNRRAYLPIDDARLDEINRDRKLIYLDPLEDYKKKLDFMRRCNYFHFFNFFILLYNQSMYAPHSIKQN